MRKPKFKPHPMVPAEDKWRASMTDGFFDAKTLGEKDPSYYLGNRLQIAFRAGWEACEANAAKSKPKKGTKR